MKMKQYLMDTLNKWQAGRDDENWSRLGRIFQDRIKDCKTELNRLVRTEDSLTLKDRIAISKARCFSEIRDILTK
jgi:hypothetical protein